MGDWFHFEMADLWWYQPDNSSRVVHKKPSGEFVIMDDWTIIAGPFASLDAAQAALLILIEG